MQIYKQTLGQRLPHKDKENQGLTLALQTYSVLETCKVDHTKIQQFKSGRWHYNVQCPSNLQGLRYKDTKTQGWMLAFKTYSVR